MSEETTVAPFYAVTGTEVAVFETAFERGLPIMLKGPTGCGKTRLVEHMADRLGVRCSWCPATRT